MKIKFNNKMVDAATLGIRMGESFLDELMAPAPLKEFIENKSRLKPGKQVVYNQPLVDERDVTLTFTIEGNTQQEYQENLLRFMGILYLGKVEIQLPVNSDTYRLTYQRSQSYAQNRGRTFCKVAVKFNEPNPGER